MMSSMMSSVGRQDPQGQPAFSSDYLSGEGWRSASVTENTITVLLMHWNTARETNNPNTSKLFFLTAIKSVFYKIYLETVCFASVNQ